MTQKQNFFLYWAVLSVISILIFIVSIMINIIITINDLYCLPQLELFVLSDYCDEWLQGRTTKHSSMLHLQTSLAVWEIHILPYLHFIRYTELETNAANFRNWPVTLMMLTSTCFRPEMITCSVWCRLHSFVHPFDERSDENLDKALKWNAWNTSGCITSSLVCRINWVQSSLSLSYLFNTLSSTG